MSTSITNPSRDFLLQDCISDYISGVYVLTQQQLRDLGQENLTYVRAQWRSQEQALTREIKFLAEAIKTFNGKSPQEVREIANRYECPDFPNIDDSDTHPEPTDEASIHRSRHATTLNFCGWCQYAWRMNCRCDYAIDPCCKLTNANYDAGSSNFFLTPCFITEMDQLELNHLVNILRLRKNSFLAQRNQIISIIRILTHAINASESKPLFPSCRTSSHFAAGEPVLYYVDPASAIFRPEIHGKLIPGYIHSTANDMFPLIRFIAVTQPNPLVCTSPAVHHSSPLLHDGYSTNIYYANPFLLKPNELAYLRTHPDYFRIWLISVIHNSTNLLPPDVAAPFAEAILTYKTA